MFFFCSSRRRFCDIRAADVLHSLVIKSCQEYVDFLRSFQPFPLRGSPLPEGQSNMDVPPWADNGQRFGRSLLTTQLWMEPDPEGQCPRIIFVPSWDEVKVRPSSVARLEE